MKKNQQLPKKHTIQHVKSLEHIHLVRPEDTASKKQLLKAKSKKKKFTAGLQSIPCSGSAKIHEKFLSGNTLSINYVEQDKLRHLEEEYRTCLRIEDGETKNNIKWLVPKSLSVSTFTTFADCVKDEDFQDLVNLSINLLHFVCKKRIFRDQDFDFVYQALTTKFPNRKEEILQIMTDVLRVLDS